MCGICGIACDRDQPIKRETLDSMTDILQHRGPDSRGSHRPGDRRGR
jgi:asparagine synthetase B (glutamine-hydrolysing)